MRCLLDSIDVRYAPSATVAVASLKRAVALRNSSPTLLALADPTADLAAAGPEVDEISRHFAPAVIRADSDEATFVFFREHANNATHIHLASHARGAFLDIADTGVELADGLAPAIEFTRLTDVSARLVVVSTCESALSAIAELPQEALSIRACNVSAGSAAASRVSGRWTTLPRRS